MRDSGRLASRSRKWINFYKFVLEVIILSPKNKKK